MSDIKKWIKALRSGKYSQTQHYLQDSHGYCCLGVACQIFTPKDKIELDTQGYINGEVPIDQKHSPLWLQEFNKSFQDRNGKGVVDINDNKKYNFNEIADIIEADYQDNDKKLFDAFLKAELRYREDTSYGKYR